jgi:hypothetical protein
MRNRTVGRPPSRALTVSGRIQPSSARPSRAPWTIRGSVKPAHSFRYTSRAVNGLATRPDLILVASTAAATRPASVIIA